MSIKENWSYLNSMHAQDITIAKMREYMDAAMLLQGENNSYCMEFEQMLQRDIKRDPDIERKISHAKQIESFMPNPICDNAEGETSKQADFSPVVQPAEAWYHVAFCSDGDTQAQFTALEALERLYCRYSDFGDITLLVKRLCEVFKYVYEHNSSMKRIWSNKYKREIYSEYSPKVLHEMRWIAPSISDEISIAGHTALFEEALHWLVVQYPEAEKYIESARKAMEEFSKTVCYAAYMPREKTKSGLEYPSAGTAEEKAQFRKQKELDNFHYSIYLYNGYTEAISNALTDWNASAKEQIGYIIDEMEDAHINEYIGLAQNDSLHLRAGEPYSKILSEQY